MISKEKLITKLFVELPYLKNIPLLNTRIDLLYELASLDESFLLLIKNLYTSKSRNLESFLAEINIIYDILENAPYLKNNIMYEKSSGNGNPDLKIEIDNVVVWIQLKHYSKSKIDKKRDVVISSLKNKLHERFEYYFDISTSYKLDLSENEIEKIINNIGKENEYKYRNGVNEVELIKNNRGYNYLKIVSGFVPTSEYKNQIVNSLIKAEKSLPKIKNDSINVIICQNINGRQDNIDIGNVLYGEEKFIYSSKPVHWERNTDGLIQNDNINVNYYCKYDTNSIIGCCEKWLFEIKPNNIIDIAKILGIDLEHKISKDIYI